MNHESFDQCKGGDEVIHGGGGGGEQIRYINKLIAAQNEYKTLMKGQYCTYSSYTLEIHAKCHHKRLTSDCIMRLCNADGGYQTTAQ